MSVLNIHRVRWGWLVAALTLVGATFASVQTFALSNSARFVLLVGLPESPADDTAGADTTVDVVKVVAIVFVGAVLVALALVKAFRLERARDAAWHALWTALRDPRHLAEVVHRRIRWPWLVAGVAVIVAAPFVTNAWGMVDVEYCTSIQIVGEPDVASGSACSAGRELDPTFVALVLAITSVLVAVAILYGFRLERPRALSSTPMSGRRWVSNGWNWWVTSAVLASAAIFAVSVMAVTRRLDCDPLPDGAISMSDAMSGTFTRCAEVAELSPASTAYLAAAGLILVSYSVYRAVRSGRVSAATPA